MTVPDDGRGRRRAPAEEPVELELNGKRLTLERHPTDFSVIGSRPLQESLSRLNFAPSAVVHPVTGETEVGAEGPAELEAMRPKGAAMIGGTPVVTAPLNGNITRVRVELPDAAEAGLAQRVRDSAMDEVRTESVAHHIYNVAGTSEEIAIDNRILLTLRVEDPSLLQEIIEAYHLQPEGEMGRAHILRVTEATGRNPIKVANEIAARPEVESCTPQVLVPMMRFRVPDLERFRLFRDQWYLSADSQGHPDVRPTAGIRAPEAWAHTTGNPNIVIAVIDDGFDLSHPAFRGKTIHSAAADFGNLPFDASPASQGEDFHGTCVASVATGSGQGDAMLGVAPGCTLLPIRIGFGQLAPQIDLLQVFKYVSQRADVANCSFGIPPSSFDRFHPEFRRALTELTKSGGRRGKGLVLVFAAGNDDAPTFLPSNRNQNGMRYVDIGTRSILEIVPGEEVFSGYPLTPGVIVVAAMSSLKRKAGYSNWGPHITVAAPSNNMHYITRFTLAGTPGRQDFVANYRGLGQVAAVNRPGQGQPFEPLPDDPATPGIREQFYTRTFGGTSGAAPVVSGVAALMLSVNPNLTADQVRQILMSTADRELDPQLDLQNDPNVQGFDGRFVNGRSLFFGSGKVDALRAVERAKAMLGPRPGPAMPFFDLQMPLDGPQSLNGPATPGFAEETRRRCTMSGRIWCHDPSQSAFLIDAATGLRWILADPGAPDLKTGVFLAYRSFRRSEPADALHELAGLAEWTDDEGHTLWLAPA